MARADLARQTCTIARAVSLVGDEWTIMILREMFLGTRRFDDFLSLGIARNVLTTRLNTLVEQGILEKRAVDGKSSDYLLTEKGLDLQPVLLSMTHWGDRHRPNAKGDRLVFVDRKNGKPIRRMAVTSEDGRRLQPRDVRAVAGPAVDERELTRYGSRGD